MDSTVDNDVSFVDPINNSFGLASLDLDVTAPELPLSNDRYDVEHRNNSLEGEFGHPYEDVGHQDGAKMSRTSAVDQIDPSEFAQHERNLISRIGQSKTHNSHATDYSRSRWESNTSSTRQSSKIAQGHRISTKTPEKSQSDADLVRMVQEKVSELQEAIDRYQVQSASLQKREKELEEGQNALSVAAGLLSRERTEFKTWREQEERRIAREEEELKEQIERERRTALRQARAVASSANNAVTRAERAELESLRENVSKYKVEMAKLESRLRAMSDRHSTVVKKFEERVKELEEMVAKYEQERIAYTFSGSHAVSKAENNSPSHATPFSSTSSTKAPNETLLNRSTQMSNSHLPSSMHPNAGSFGNVSIDNIPVDSNREARISRLSVVKHSKNQAAMHPVPTGVSGYNERFRRMSITRKPAGGEVMDEAKGAIGEITSRNMGEGESNKEQLPVKVEGQSESYPASGILDESCISVLHGTNGSNLDVSYVSVPDLEVIPSYQQQKRLAASSENKSANDSSKEASSLDQSQADRSIPSQEQPNTSAHIDRSTSKPLDTSMPALPLPSALASSSRLPYDATRYESLCVSPPKTGPALQPPGQTNRKHSFLVPPPAVPLDNILPPYSFASTTTHMNNRSITDPTRELHPSGKQGSLSTSLLSTPPNADFIRAAQVPSRLHVKSPQHLQQQHQQPATLDNSAALLSQHNESTSFSAHNSLQSSMHLHLPSAEIAKSQHNTFEMNLSTATAQSTTHAGSNFSQNTPVPQALSASALDLISGLGMSVQDTIQIPSPVNNTSLTASNSHHDPSIVEVTVATDLSSSNTPCIQPPTMNPSQSQPSASQCHSVPSPEVTSSIPPQTQPSDALQPSHPSQAFRSNPQYLPKPLHSTTQPEGYTPISLAVERRIHPTFLWYFRSRRSLHQLRARVVNRVRRLPAFPATGKPLLHPAPGAVDISDPTGLEITVTRDHRTEQLVRDVTCSDGRRFILFPSGTIKEIGTKPLPQSSAQDHNISIANARNAPIEALYESEVILVYMNGDIQWKSAQSTMDSYLFSDRNTMESTILLQQPVGIEKVVIYDFLHNNQVEFHAPSHTEVVFNTGWVDIQGTASEADPLGKRENAQSYRETYDASGKRVV